MPETFIFEGTIAVRVRARGKMAAAQIIRTALLSSAIGFLDYAISDFKVIEHTQKTEAANE